jgi:hypothetical protein
VLRSHGLDDDTIINMLTVTVPDQLGDRSTLYDRRDVQQAVRDPKPLKPMVDDLVAELLVSAGGHPAGARHLAESSGQPASVINLMEERLRRADPEQAPADRRAARGLSLIDEWTGPGTPESPVPSPAGEPLPSPPEPPAA